ncbi:MAG: hypothetical protein JOZ19_09535 [Rubrobacter sp.]|nr:hypothetical protein [Rubrobacter sp.]
MPRRRPQRREHPLEDQNRGAIRPESQRAFGCVTWVNMGMLAFLAAAFLLPLPFRYVGNGEIFSEIQLRLALLGLILIVPGMALGAVLGARTYRVEGRLGARAGAGIGAAVGLNSYLLVFSLFEDIPLLLASLVPSAGLLLYALFATGQALKRRQWIVLLAVILSVFSGAVALILEFDLLLLLGAVFCMAAATIGGFVGGIGYARAGGNAMLPPGALHRKIDQ